MVDPILFWLAPIVFIAGFIDSIAGGGGLLTVPAYLVAGIPPTPTLGTNKFVSTVGTFVSTAKYVLSGRMLWPVVVVGIPCTLIGSMIGAQTIATLDPSIVRKVILFALPVAALLTLLPKPKEHSETTVHWSSARLWITIPPITFALGWYDGFFGPGTGSLLMLALYGIGRLSFLHSAAVARVFNLISNVGALFTFLIHKQVLWHLGLPLGLAGIAGHYVGSHVALRNGAGIVRGMLILSCSLLFGYLIWQSL